MSVRDTRENSPNWKGVSITPEWMIDAKRYDHTLRIVAEHSGYVWIGTGPDKKFKPGTGSRFDMEELDEIITVLSYIKNQYEQLGPDWVDS